MMFIKAAKAVQITAVATITYLLLATFFGSPPSIVTKLWIKLHGSDLPGRQILIPDNKLSHIHNETLGFEHIYAISLPERTDKRDFLSLAAALSGMKVQWLDGVKMDTISQKAMPNGYDTLGEITTFMASWRAHMNALLSVVQNGYSTALILEDDADWDVTIKQQLVEFARGLHTLQGTETVSKIAPYGTNWDILWIGACISGPSRNETRFYAIPEDPTVASSRQRQESAGVPESWKERVPEDSTRFVYNVGSGLCTFGYAVTKRGAEKIIAALSVDHTDTPIDNAFHDLCTGTAGRQRIDCYAVNPNIIGTFRAAGSASRDSDINGGGEGQFHEARSINMIYSIKKNIHRLVSGESTVFAQWRNDDLEPWQEDEIDPDEFKYPKGYLVEL